MPQRAAGAARAKAEELVARIAADLNGPLTRAVLAAAIAEVTDALAEDLARERLATEKAWDRRHFDPDFRRNR